VSSITAQAKQFPLKKPAGFHWDFFLLGCTSFIAGIIGIPLPNGLVPQVHFPPSLAPPLSLSTDPFAQAPVHTDACTDYTDTLTVIHTSTSFTSLPTSAINQKTTTVRRVAEQRLSHFLMALLIIGTMTHPLLIVLATTPRALYAGVFFVVGAGSVLGNNLTGKAVYLLTEPRFVSPDDERRALRRGRIAAFLAVQAVTVAVTVAMSQTLGAIGFPVVITALVPFRWVVIPRMFSRKELQVLDGLTADNPVVLASMGGKPVLPELQMEGYVDEEKKGDRTSGSGTGSEEASTIGRERRRLQKGANGK